LWQRVEEAEGSVCFMFEPGGQGGDGRSEQVIKFDADVGDRPAGFKGGGMRRFSGLGARRFFRNLQCMSAESVNAFVSRWASASPSERANRQLFLTERPSTLDLQPPKAGLCSAGPAVGASKAFVSIVRTDPFSRRVRRPLLCGTNF
jgi:hypothetical protein